jgi:glycosyltransferase involved in cell wall biosynthesis
LQPSPHDLDVCLLADGIDARTIGGVSRFAAELATQLPHLTFNFSPSLGELPPARVYHALTPLAAARAGAGVRAKGRPLLLTCHAMSDAWRPEGVASFTLDASHGGGGGGGDDQGGDDQGHGHGHDDDWQDGDDHDHGKGNDKPSGSAVVLERRGYAAADLITAVSGAVAGSHVAAGAPADRMLVLPNGAPAVPAAAPAVAEPIVGFVGRVARVKALPRLLAAMRLVRTARPDARLVVVGPAEASIAYQRRLRRLAHRPGLRGAVSFVGPQRAERWYPTFACLALASDSEGMPLALLEAMAHGVPCVAPDVGGVRETLGEAGVVVAPRDAGALASGILRVLDDAREAERLAAAGRARAAGWTAADAAAAYAGLYAQLGGSCRTSCC